MRNLTAGEGISSGLAGIPSGYRNQYSRLQPQKPGDLSSRNEIQATSSMAGDGTMGVNLEVLITGEALLEAVGQLVVSAVAEISATSTVSANVVAALAMSADLSASGSVSGSLDALAWAVAELAGQSTTDFVPSATGELEASIDNAAGALTPDTIAAAILDAVDSIETGVTLRQATRLILAAAAGRVSGAGTSTVTIRNAVANDTNRIVATVDENGNRTAITTDLD